MIKKTFIFIVFCLSIMQPPLVIANSPLVENFSIQLSKQLEENIHRQCQQWTKDLAKAEMQDSLGPMNQLRFKKIYDNNYPLCMVETIKRVKNYFASINTKPDRKDFNIIFKK
ncbi:hypothetical protein [Piscirickettsia salmonis]|nr:hypothetical protein [Piscirickettsia salmonis]